MQSQNWTRRKFLQTVGMVSAGAALVACAPAPAGAPASEGSAPSPEKRAVRVQAAAIPTTMNALNHAVTAHAEQYPDVEILLEETIYGEISRKTETGALTGTLQDVCYGHMRWFHYGCFKGIYMSLEDLIASDPPEDYEDFFPRWMESNAFRGEVFCLPMYAKPGPVSSVIYNKQILEEKGVPEPTEPWTFDDLAEMAIACTDPDAGYFGCQWRFNNDIHSYTNFCRYYGANSTDDQSGWLVVDEGRTFRMNTDTIRQASNLVLDLIHTHQAWPLAGDDVDGGLFAAGRLAFRVEQVADTFIAESRKVGDRFEIGHLMAPTGPEGRRGTANVGNQLMINSQTEVVNDSWDFLKTLTSKEICVLSALEGIEPGRRSAWVDPRVTEALPIFEQAVDLMDTYVEPFPMPWNLRYVEANSVFVNEIDLIIRGERTWDEHIGVVEQEVQAIFDLDMPAEAS